VLPYYSNSRIALGSPIGEHPKYAGPDYVSGAKDNQFASGEARNSVLANRHVGVTKHSRRSGPTFG
jgi:hypothetical protein